MYKIALVSLLFATIVSANEELFVPGDTYRGQPIICRTQNDATELAEIYTQKGVEEFHTALIDKSEKHLCFAGQSISFVIVKEVSAHVGEETVYVIEVSSGGTHYIVTTRKVAKLPTKFV